MSDGIMERDFQIAETMGWHRMTTLKVPEQSDFPNIVARDLLVAGPDGKPSPFTIDGQTYFLPVSEDDGLPVAPPYCGDSYTLYTPREAWDYVAACLSGTGYSVKSIGMLKNRSKWFISTELSELKDLKAGDGRETRFMLNFSGGLDRMMSPQAELSAVTIVCQNTLNASRLSGQVFFRIKATKGFKIKLEAQKAEIEKLCGVPALFKAQMDKLAEKKCDSARAERLFAGFLTPFVNLSDRKPVKVMSTRTANTVSELRLLHSEGIGNQGQSEFDALNAVTQLYTRGSSDEARPERIAKIWQSGEFGQYSDRKADFASLLVNRKTRVDLGKGVVELTLKDVETRGKELLAISGS